MIKLSITTPEGKSEFASPEPSLLIGRAGECPIKLTDKKSSRQHARLEKVENVWRLRDLDTPNGTLLNGIKVLDTVLASGDEIRIGETVIRVVELDTPPLPVARSVAEEPPKPPVPLEKKLEIKGRIDGARRAHARAAGSGGGLRLPLTLAGAVVVAVVGLLLLREAMDATSRGSAQARTHTSGGPERAEAERILGELRARIESAAEIPDALVQEIADASRRYGGLFETRKGALSPFDHLVTAVLQRRASVFIAHVGRAREEVDTHLAARRYGQALAALAALQGRVGPAFEDAVRDMVRQVDERVDVDYLAVKEQGTRLEQAERYAEAIAHYQAHAAPFAGTRHHALLSGKPDALAALAKAKGEALLARQNDPTLQPPPVTPEVRKAEATGLVARIIDNVRTGKFVGRSYTFEAGKSGVPVNADAEAITLTAPSGDLKIAWSTVTPAVIFKMTSEVLKGDELFTVADYGHENGLKEEANRLLVRLLNLDKKNKPRVDESVARARGISAPPEGGYTWDQKHGWEDVVERDNRTAVEISHRHVRDLVASNDGKKRAVLFGKLQDVYDKSTLTEATRQSIRTHAVEQLNGWKKKNLDGIAKRAKNQAALGQLRNLKIELNRRRKAALDLIYDEKIYLREDHPDWSKGDDANGQTKVDELVDRVREIWERSGSLVAGMSPEIKRDLDEIAEVNERYLAALGEQVDTEAELKDYEEILNNLNARIDIKSYCMDGRDKQLYKWNRAVDAYNEQLKHADVGEEEKAHFKVLNDYREMMGRKRLFLDPRLCRATKKHSAVCDRAGRIWHVGEDGDPQSRAQAEGFSGGVGENVCLGYSSPVETWTRGWYRASDHHRGGLSDAYNCGGYGYVGNVGTENFSNIGTPKGF